MKGWTIQADGLCKSYGSQSVLKDFDMELAGGGIYCLMAPSGAGKTTLLRLLSGLEQPDRGKIRYISTEAETACTPAQMTFAFVFQEDRLCPGLGAVKNVELVHPVVTGQMLQEEIGRLLPREALSKPVSEFSGGMSRRTALLRAMLSPGEVLLMDEPFTGLDEDSRQAAYRYVLEHRNGRTLLFTTHHEEEGKALGAAFYSL